MDTTIDFVKTLQNSRNNPFLKTIPKNNLEQGNHNARCSNDRTRRETQDKNVLLNFKVFEKIKQVSSTKLTNWYKNISRRKTDKFFHRLIFLGANLKVSKILLQSLRASFRKMKNYFSENKNQPSPKLQDLVFLQKKKRLSFPPTLSQKKKVRNPGLRLCSRKTQSSKRDFRVYIKYLKVNK